MICIGQKKNGNKCTYRAKYGNYCGIHMRKDILHLSHKKISSKDIFNAAKKGQLSSLQSMLVGKKDVTQMREDGKNLLAIALINRRLGTARYLSRTYPDMHTQPDQKLPKYPGIPDGMMFIFYHQMDVSFDWKIANRIIGEGQIISCSNLPWLYHFLDKFPINQENYTMVDAQGNTFLHMMMRFISTGTWMAWMFRDGFIKKLRHLDRRIVRDSVINIQNAEGKTCLHLFCEKFYAVQLDIKDTSDPFYKNKTFMGRIIDEGADITIEDNKGVSILQIPHVIDTYNSLLGKYYFAAKGMLKWSRENHRFFSRSTQRDIANLFLLNKRKKYFCRLVMYRIIGFISG